jgi:serine/threonine protein kinase
VPESKRHHNALPNGYQLNVYRIEHVIGQGGFGITYLAEDNLDRKVAIKEYLPSELATRIQEGSEVRPISDDQNDMYQWGLRRFLDEAKTLARFKHPNIISILSYFEENSTAYAVMPYEEGDPLDKLIRQDKFTDEKSLLEILMPILDGLEKVHEQGLIHRDIKPANIYIRHDDSPVLLDFGSARTAVGQQSRTLTAVISPGYAPFEQYHGSGDKQGPWTDIYALGATLYAIVNRGRGPAEATMRANVLLEERGDPLVPALEIGRGRYSDTFLSAIDDALIFRPDKRPQSISEWRNLFSQSQLLNKAETIKRDQADIPTVIDDANLHSQTTIPGKSYGTVADQKSDTNVWFWSALGLAALLVGGVTWYQLQPTGSIEPGTSQQEQTIAPIVKTEDAIDVNNRQREVITQEEAGKEYSAAQKQAAAPEIMQQRQQFTIQQFEQEKPQIPDQFTRYENIIQLLDAAYMDIDALRLTTPAGNNAFEKFNKVLELDPGNMEAIEGLNEMFEEYRMLANEALEEGNFDAAVRYIDGAIKVRPQEREFLEQWKFILLQQKQEFGY